MRKNFLIQICIFFGIFLCFLVPIKVDASNNIDEIKMIIHLQKNGDAIVTEDWDTFLDQGTELYKSYGNLNSSKIFDFSVSMGNGRNYQFQNSWNIQDNFDQKKYKNGIVQKQNGIELCWGISEYGRQQYHIKYQIKNLIKQYQDQQGIYFTFIPMNMNPTPRTVSIQIESESILFKEENSNVSVLGYSNGAFFYQNGKIMIKTKETLDKNQYITALIGFKNGMFSPGFIENKTFKEIEETKINSEKPSLEIKTIFYLFFLYSLPLILAILFLLLACFRYLSFRKSQRERKTLRKKKLEVSASFYYREIPLSKDLCKICYLSFKFDLLQDESHILGAYLLKWLKEKRISITTKESGVEKICSIHFDNLDPCSTKIEDRLKTIFVSASCNGTLEINTFKEWCQKNYQQVISWFSDFSYEGTIALSKDGLVKRERIDEKTSYGKVSRERLFLKEEANEIGRQLIGLKHFLLDFGTFHEKEVLETIVWEDYLIMAELFGITKEVEKNLSQFYPNGKWFTKLMDLEKITYVLQYAKTGYQACCDAFLLVHSSLPSFYGSNQVVSSNSIQKTDSLQGSSSGGFSSGGGVR